jgi:hypothetical protein
MIQTFACVALGCIAFAYLMDGISTLQDIIVGYEKENEKETGE